MLKHFIRASFLAAACIMATHSAFAADKPGGPIKIVTMSSYTGPAMNALAPAGKGFEAFVEFTNRNGGVDGRKIDLQVIDDQSSTNVGGALISRVVADAPVAFAHFGLSTTLTQAKAVLQSAPLAVLSISADDSLIYPEPMKNVFMVNASGRQQALALLRQAEQLIGGLKGKKLALALHQTAYNDSIVAALRTLAQTEGYELVAVERYNLGIPSFSSQGARIARTQPDAVLIAAVAGDTPIVVGAISDAGVNKAPIVGYAAMASSEVFQKLNLPNFFAFRPYNVGSEMPALVSQVAEQYRSGMGNSLWTLGWAAGEVLVGALKKCGNDCTGAKLVTTLEGGGPLHSSHSVLYGPMHFTSKNHAGLTAVQPYKLEGGVVKAAGRPINIGQ